MRLGRSGKIRVMRPARRLLLIFSVAILAPGLILGFFGVRALLQEGLVLDRQIQEHLDTAAQEAGRRLESELEEWQRATVDIARSQIADVAEWPEHVRRTAAVPGGAVVLLGARGAPQEVPQGQLLYVESLPLEEPVRLPAAFDEAETLEQQDQFDQAIALYRRLLTDAKPPNRAVIQNALARTQKKSGRLDESLRAYQRLAEEPSTRIGSLPSDLIALFQLAEGHAGRVRADHALRLYQGLVDGRWRLEKPSYMFYAHQARGWIDDPEATERLGATEARKLALTQAVGRFLGASDDTVPVTAEFTMMFSSDEPFAAVVVGTPFLHDQLLPAVEAPGFVYSIVGAHGQTIDGGELPAGQPFATFISQRLDRPVGIRVWAADLDGMSAGLRRQRNLYIGATAIVIALLAFGGYFTLRTLKSELAVAQMKSDFVSTVSHEFRSPLTGINQLAEMLRDGRVDDDPHRRHEYYEMIVSETRRLRRLVENILDFSRMEDGRKQYRFEPLEPAAWLREVTEDFRGQVVASGFAVESHIPPTLPDILADRETLTTAVNNLLDNAVKYSPIVKCVRVEAEADRQALRISVRDQGVGIRDEDRLRIFEKFYRGGGQLANQVKGVGLGLNLVQHIVRAHGGTVDFDSREGEGSTFTIRLNYDSRSAG